MMSVFISITFDGITSFSRIKNSRNTCKRLYYSQSSWWDFYVITENWKHLKDTLISIGFLNRVLLTSDLSPSVYDWLSVSRQ